MMKTLLCALALILAVAHAADPNLDADWEDFKQRFGKIYDDATNEEGSRRETFESNLALIGQHNEEAANGVHTYTLGLNKYADMTAEEFASTMNGFKPDMKKVGTGKAHESLEKVSLPNTVDWRKHGYVTPIKDQMQCGSCWAFSATGSLEGQNFKKNGKLVSLSEQNLVDCDKIDSGCLGGLMDNAFTYIKENKGIDTESSYPYQGVQGAKCLFKESDVGATDVSFVDVPSKDESALQNAVATIGPISVAIDASQPTFHLYSSGVYSDANCSEDFLDHGVLAIGYGTEEDGTDYWLVKNSWGITWGMDGFIKMSRNNNNNCGIATSASYPTLE